MLLEQMLSFALKNHHRGTKAQRSERDRLKMHHFRQRLKNDACYRGEIVRDVDPPFCFIILIGAKQLLEF
jgi:hypothetical protein